MVISSCIHTLAVIKIDLNLLLHHVNTAGDFKPSVPPCWNMNIKCGKASVFLVQTIEFSCMGEGNTLPLIIKILHTAKLSVQLSGRLSRETRREHSKHRAQVCDILE